MTTARPRSGSPGHRAIALVSALLATAALGACATQVNLPALSDCHPANPDAPTTPRASPAPLGSALGEPTPEDHGTMDHGAMDHGTMDHDTMDHGGMDHGAMEEQTTVYACPMHPEVRSDQPGECPICGMALQPLPATEGDGADDAGADEPGEAHHHHHGAEEEPPAAPGGDR